MRTGLSTALPLHTCRLTTGRALGPAPVTLIRSNTARLMFALHESTAHLLLYTLADLSP